MDNSPARIVLFLLLAFLLFRPSRQNDLLVQTTSGTVEGIQQTSVTGATVNAFLGIPFAAPPVGDLRFRPPVPVAPSENVIKAHEQSKACLQVFRVTISDELDKEWIPPVEETSEDCLYLNIWTPSPKPEKSAVMVWIHGGGYEAGTANSKIYDGKMLAAEGVIFVAMNYRLSLFGFLLLDPEEAPGNVGLMDQAFALKWVQNNIAAFGGDPNRVTIFGESAGGGSVGHHVLIPSSQGLFHRAILQSGTAQAAWSVSDKQTAVKAAETLLEDSGCNLETQSDKIKCLRGKDGLDLVLTSKKNGGFVGLITFNPVVDGSYIPEDPLASQLQQKFSKNIDILLGSTKDDGFIFPLIMKHLDATDDFFADEGNFTNFAKILLNSENEMLLKMVKFIYTDWENEPDNWRKAISDFATDLVFACPMAVTADLAAVNGNKVYVYQLDQSSSMNPFPKWSGVIHADDLPFVFGLARIQPNKFTSEEAQLSQRIMKYWTEFAKTGDPNFEDKVTWPLYTLTERKVLSLQVKENIFSGVRLQRCSFFTKLLPQLSQIFHENEVQHCDVSDPKSKCFRY